ncbi:MAG: Trk family potassium uptake protein [Dehalococcoidia bacterium]|nr:Trk family potassium uptake protein [Dehalococcoidia bacterium]MCA9849503.1 Trk family potassium uptake protein [Dehalococcoidia bacterium]MCB9490590.1 Trk family potassium uptake protein [Dehalococcoidia bacterium]
MHSGGQQRQGAQIGNLRVRRGRRQRQVVEVERPPIRRPRRPSVLFLVGGFLALIAIGAVLLWLPFASRDPGSVSLLTALFTSTSAVCVTGLVVVDTYDSWTTFGQVVILALIQLGGLGFMASATLLLLVLGRRLSLGQRVVTASLTGTLGAASVGDLLRRIFVMTLVIEAAGTAILIALFAVAEGALDARVAWRGLFTAVSGFNNAGFDIEGGGRSLSHFATHPLILLTVAALTIAGGLGYAVLWDLRNIRRWRALSLNSKIVLSTYAVLQVLGTLAIFAREAFGNGTLASYAWPHAFVSSFAESAYSRTSGFTAFDLGHAEPDVLLIIAGLMFIGGASGSTAGGIKVNTFTSLFATIIASIRGEEHVHLFQREIPWTQVNRALTVALLSVAFVFTSAIALHATNDADALHSIFEAVSAFGTVGLSAGITGTLNAAGQLVLIVAMFVGRVGPLTIALALTARFSARERIRYPEAEINIG